RRARRVLRARKQAPTSGPGKGTSGPERTTDNIGGSRTARQGCRPSGVGAGEQAGRAAEVGEPGVLPVRPPPMRGVVESGTSLKFSTYSPFRPEHYHSRQRNEALCIECGPRRRGGEPYAPTLGPPAPHVNAPGLAVFAGDMQE